MDKLSPEKKAEIVAKLKDDNEIKGAVEKVFEKVDKNKSGFIEKNEVQTVLKGIAFHVGAPEPNDEQIEKVVALFDTSKDGKISKEELFNAFKKMAEYILSKIEA